MEAVIASIRAKHGVSEQMMTQAMVANQGDARVAEAVTALREAMNGKPPPDYGTPTEAEQAAAARKSPTRRKSANKRR